MSTFAPLRVLGEDGLPVADKLVFVRPEGAGAEIRFRLDERGEARLGWSTGTVVPAGKHPALVRDYRDTLAAHEGGLKCFLVLKDGEPAARLVADAGPDWTIVKDAQAAGLAARLVDHAEKA